MEGGAPVVLLLLFDVFDVFEVDDDDVDAVEGGLTLGSCFGGIFNWRSWLTS